MTNPLLQAIDEIKREEQAKKKKPIFNIKKEKRLQYYSGWGRGKKDNEKVERQENKARI